MNNEATGDYYCVYNPILDSYLGGGINKGATLSISWLTEGNVLEEEKCAAIHILPFGGSVDTIDSLINTIKKAFDSKHYPDRDTLTGCVLINVDLDDGLDIVNINHDIIIKGRL